MSFRAFNCCFNVLALILVVGSFLINIYGPLFICVHFSKQSMEKESNGELVFFWHFIETEKWKDLGIGI